MQSGDIKTVAAIHNATLPEDFCSKLGVEFMEKQFYPHILENEANTAIVAEDASGAVVGYVTFAPAKGFYSSLVKAELISFLAYLFRAMFRSPALIPYAIEVIYLLFSKKTYQATDDEIELLYIAVSSDQQGKQIGAQLLERSFIELARLEDYETCVVKTLESTTETNRFYTQNGFSQVHSAFGRVWYSKVIDNSGVRIRES